MNKNRFVYTNILFYLAMALTGFVVENLAALRQHLDYGFDRFSFCGMLFITMSLFLTYLYINRRVNKIKTSWIAIVFLVGFAILNICSIWSHGNQLDFYVQLRDQTYTLYLSNNKKLYYTLQMLLFVALLYITFTVFSHINVRFKSFNWLLVGIVLFVYSTIIASLFIDSKSYVDFFNYDLPVEKIHSVKSFFMNENAFGHCLFLGILTCMGLNIKRNNFFIYVTILIFFTFLFFSTCATAIFIALVVIPAYFIIKIGLIFNDNKTNGVLAISIVLFIAGIIGVCLAIGLNSDYLPLFSRVHLFGKLLVYNKDFFGVSGRGNVWNIVASIIRANSSTKWIGLGFGIFKEAILTVPHFVKSAHNGYLEIVGNYGLIGMICYVILVFYFIICCLRLIGYGHGEYGAIALLAFGSILAYGLAESTYFFQNNMVGILQTTIIFAPPISLCHRLKHKEEDERILSMEIKNNKDIKPLSRFIGYICISSFIVLLMTFFMFINTTHLKLRCALVSLLVMNGCLLFVYPTLIAHKLIEHRGPFYFVLDFIFTPFLKVGISVFVFLIAKTNANSFVTASIFGSLTFVSLTLFDFLFISKAGVKRIEAIKINILSVFNKEWTYLLPIFVATVIAGISVKAAMNPDHLEKSVIVCIVLATLINSYYLFFKKEHFDNMSLLEDYNIVYQQELIRREEIYE